MKALIIIALLIVSQAFTISHPRILAKEMEKANTAQQARYEYPDDWSMLPFGKNIFCISFN